MSRAGIRPTWRGSVAGRSSGSPPSPDSTIPAWADARASRSAITAVSGSATGSTGQASAFQRSKSAYPSRTWTSSGRSSAAAASAANRPSSWTTVRCTDVIARIRPAGTPGVPAAAPGARSARAATLVESSPPLIITVAGSPRSRSADGLLQAFAEAGNGVARVAHPRRPRGHASPIGRHAMTGSLAPREQVARRHAPDVGEHRVVRILRIAEQEEVAHRAVEEPVRDVRYPPQARGRIRHGQPTGGARVVERGDAEVIARAEEPALVAVPETPGEVAEQVRRRVEAPRQVGAEDQIGVGGRRRIDREVRPQSAPELVPAIEPAVEHGRHAARGSRQRGARQAARAAGQRSGAEPGLPLHDRAHHGGVEGRHRDGVHQQGALSGRAGQAGEGDEARHRADPRESVPRAPAPPAIRDRISGAPT